MGKINIAELLKDCPRGMELDCTMFDYTTLHSVSIENDYPIKIVSKNGCTSRLTKYGQYINSEDAKCVIFPRGKNTWEGFHRPFVEGDIVSTQTGIYIGIVKSTEDSHHCDVFCSINDTGDFFIDKNLLFSRLATEEEKQKLFDAIRVNGYKWNTETKTLEKLPKFKVGDRVKHISAYTSGIVVKVSDKGYYIDYHKGEGVCYVSFELEKDYELAPNKFDITTLKPFDSRVLVRDDSCYEWEADIFGRYSDDYITLGGGKWKQCIPYEGNEHLFGTTNDCDDFYKTWEE